jgi:hypothetical protein
MSAIILRRPHLGIQMPIATIMTADASAVRTANYKPRGPLLVSVVQPGVYGVRSRRAGIALDVKPRQSLQLPSL